MIHTKSSVNLQDGKWYDIIYKTFFKWHNIVIELDYYLGNWGIPFPTECWGEFLRLAQENEWFSVVWNYISVFLKPHFSQSSAAEVSLEPETKCPEFRLHLSGRSSSASSLLQSISPLCVASTWSWTMWVNSGSQERTAPETRVPR